MKRTITACICALVLGGPVIAQNYQIPNSDFEANWTKNEKKSLGKVKYTEMTPDFWHSFYDAKGDAASLAFLVADQTGKLDQTVGRNGTGYAAKITGRKNLYGTISNGNLTIGIVNMGSATASDKSNYNYSEINNENGHCEFAGLPDSVKVWVKFESQDVAKGNASVSMILHTNVEYRDPSVIMGEEAEKAARIAKAYSEIIPNAEWMQYTIPFEYNDNDLYKTYTDQKYMLASFSTNKTPGEGTTGDALSVDDIQMIYNSKLESITIAGAALKGFDKETYTYVIKGDLPGEDDIVAVSDGKGANVDIQEGDNVIKIIVTGNDGAKNQHVYSLVKEGTTFSATDIALNDVKLEDFDPAVTSYEGLEMINGIYPVVSVYSDPNLTSVDMLLNTKEHTVTIVVTDNFNKIDHTYTLKFIPSDRVINNSQIKGNFEKQTQWGPEGEGESTRWGTIADGWFSSNVTQLGSMNFVMVEEESHVIGDDKLAVKMINGRPGAMGIESNAPGYIALGRPWVYADMIGLMSSVFPGGVPDADDSDGGTVGGVNFSYRPDSIVGYYKRTYADAGSGLKGMNPNENAEIIAYLWKGISTSMAPATGDMFTSTGSAWQLLIDRDIDILGTKNGGVPAEGITLIASAERIVKELADWTRISIPLNYVSDEKPEKANVIISSADYFNRANIGNGNTLSADNVAFVYNSKLKSITISGTTLTGFDKDTYEYAVDGAMPVVADVVAEADGKGATVEVTAAGKVLTITVKGNDITDNATNYHTYTLTFKGGVGVEQDTYNSLSIKGIESGVVVEGAQLEDLIEVYSVQGMLVAQSTVNGTMTIHGLSSNTIYLVKIGSYVTRVMTK